MLMSTIDIHVGAKIKARRVTLEISPYALALALNISVADLVHYENGRRRVCVSLLFEIANTLDVEIGYFFSGMTFASDTRLAATRKPNLYMVN